MVLKEYTLKDNYRWLFIVTSRLKKIGLYEMCVKYKRHYLINLIQKKHIIISQINLDLSELTNIERDIYCEIIINGNSIKETIKKFSLLYNYNELVIWKNCFLKVNSKIENLINIIFDN